MRLPNLILASQSPRRRQLLETLGFPFKVIVKDTEEVHPNSKEVGAVTIANAKAKVDAVVDSGLAQSVIIGADTLVVLRNQVLGKPKNKEHAKGMLETLSGSSHDVVTGLCLRLNEKYEMVAVQSSVVFRKLDPKEIELYLSTKEPYDKAGSYAIQGLGSLFIERVEGSFSNVMGFPIEQFLVSLSHLTGTSVYEWFK